MPAVPVPPGARIKPAVDVTLKPGWRFDPERRVLESKSGERVSLRGRLPRKSRVVHTVARLARSRPAALSPSERTLQRHLQVILPAGESPAAHLDAIRAWPGVADVRLPPSISLPGPTSTTGS
jgi:hypothetical protein